MERALTGLSKLAKGSKSTKDLAKLSEREWPTDASQYELLEDCGRGVSATVHRALCLPFHEIVAIKKMNLESMQCDLEEIIHEAQTMRHYNHPNVLPLYASFVEGQDLWMVMPFIAGGSVLHVMKYAYPDGLDEVVIATVGREVLKALDYVHKNGGIHRDVKAGNILVDVDGCVKLADFGVAANLERNGSWGKNKVARMTFVGTPCWMAPEVMEQTSGYDSSADIWSFGITLLEMAHGHAPFAKFPPMKVLLMTLQNPPPTLDDKGKKHFSKAIRDVVARCLQKDSRLRPTAAQLLEHKFFKTAKDEKFLRDFVLNGLPPLGERVQEIRQGKAATTAVENDKAFNRSQDEYKKGISTWNFDLEALKAQAALEPDEDGTPSLPTITEDDGIDPTIGHAGAVAASAAVAAAVAGVATTNTMAPAPGAGAPNMVSVFATREGQQVTQQATGVMPPPAPIIPGESSGDIGQQRPLTTETSQGASAVPLSPGTTSPTTGISREGSCKDSLNNMSQTPTVGKQRKAGRFNVYEDPTAAPPLSPADKDNGLLPGGVAPSGNSMQDLSAMGGMGSRPGSVLSNMVSMSGPDGLVPMRTSDDGSRREDGQEAEQPVPAAQKKGRFTVIENESRPLSKSTSVSNIVDGKLLTKSEPGTGSSNALGKPPPAPTSNMAVLPITSVMPKLQELLDHTTQHQLALQRLMEAVRDNDRGKGSQLLSRTATTRPLFESAGMDEQALYQLEALKLRVSELEAENGRLRAHNQQLTLQLGQSDGGAMNSRPGSMQLVLDVSAQALEGRSPVPLSPRPITPEPDQ